MLRPIVKRLAERKVILATESPRRKQILQHINFPFAAVQSAFEENLDKSKFDHPWQYAVENAKGKAWDVANGLKGSDDWFVVIGADTIVVKDGTIYEKPKTSENANEMLRSLSGMSHQVITGVSLVYRDGDNLIESNFHDVTDVILADLTDEMITDYIESGEPLDKAGGYGIQDVGGTLVKSINGDYYNVVGLPLHRMCAELLRILSE